MRSILNNNNNKCKYCNKEIKNMGQLGAAKIFCSRPHIYIKIMKKKNNTFQYG